MANAAPWRQVFLDAMEANKHLKHSKFFQLATVKPSGAPAVRTVIFRGFEEGSNKFLTTTDARSRKVEDLKARPLGELLVYFTDTWEQFRFSGKLHLIGPQSSSEEQKTRNALWESTPDKTLVGFAGPPPRQPMSSNEPDPEVDKNQGPLDTFVIVSLEPTEVDYYHSRQQIRVIFEKRDGAQWTQQAVQP